MADTKLSGLTATSTLIDTDEFYVNDGGVSKKITKADLQAQISAGVGYNYLINGNKKINQREYAGGVLADGEYGYDRWKGHSSDANIEQVIEQISIPSGTYTISWVGGGTASVNGVGGLSSGDSLVVTVISHVSVIVPKAATEIKLERGSAATPYVPRLIGEEWLLCQRFYETGIMDAYGYIGSGFFSAAVDYKAQKRAQPTVTITDETLSNLVFNTTKNYRDRYVRVYANAGTPSVNCECQFTYAADCEL